MSNAEAQAEVERLVDRVLPHAEGMLIEHGQFFPFAGALTLEGEIAELAVGEEHKHSSVEVVVEALERMLRGAAENFRATALAFPVEAELPGGQANSDAVAIALDHRDDFSVVLIIPYVLSEGAVQFGEAVAQQGEHGIFGRRA
ncbi:MAG: hypothetical protein R3286_06330 [Gammaproteobacteria bacterium]|nr:hypothetical protein [Gammaproteobacteria bacterium]